MQEKQAKYIIIVFLSWDGTVGTVNMLGLDN